MWPRFLDLTSNVHFPPIFSAPHFPSAVFSTVYHLQNLTTSPPLPASYSDFAMHLNHSLINTYLTYPLPLSHFLGKLSLSALVRRKNRTMLSYTLNSWLQILKGIQHCLEILHFASFSTLHNNNFHILFILNFYLLFHYQFY